MKNNTKQRKRTPGRHEVDTRFFDHRAPQHYGLGTEFGRAKHRAEGPMNTLVLQDMSPDDFTSAKGLGPRY